jgi:hypothetical protein
VLSVRPHQGGIAHQVGDLLAQLGCGTAQPCGIRGTNLCYAGYQVVADEQETFPQPVQRPGHRGMIRERAQPKRVSDLERELVEPVERAGDRHLRLRPKRQRVGVAGHRRDEVGAQAQQRRASVRQRA